MRIDILGVGFDDLTVEEAADQAMLLLEKPGVHYVVTPNPEIVAICRKDAAAREAVNNADLVLPDGIGVVYGAKILGTPLKGRAPGIDFAGALMKRMAEYGKSLYLLGAKPGIAEQAAAALQEKYPGLRVVGTADGYFKDDAAAAQRLCCSGADVAFVCLGAPKQELWMRNYGMASGAKLLCGLGGSLDVFAGVVDRAPEFYCRHGLEWLYRLMKEPKRIGRMMKLPLFLCHAAAAKGKKK